MFLVLTCYESQEMMSQNKMSKIIKRTGTLSEKDSHVFFSHNGWRTQVFTVLVVLNRVILVLFLKAEAQMFLKCS